MLGKPKLERATGDLAGGWQNWDLPDQKLLKAGISSGEAEALLSAGGAREKEDGQGGSQWSKSFYPAVPTRGLHPGRGMCASKARPMKKVWEEERRNNRKHKEVPGEKRRKQLPLLKTAKSVRESFPGFSALSPFSHLLESQERKGKLLGKADKGKKGK